MKKILRSYAIITLGSLIFALAFDWFVVPNRIAMGGITGLAQIIHALAPALTVGMLSFVMNVPLFLLGWKLIGGHLLVSSLFAMAVSSVAVDGIALLYDFAPMDPMLASLYGGAVMGLGLGIVFTQGATTGGTDIIGKLLKLKFPWLPIGKLIIVPDMVVIVLVAVVFGTVNAVLYGIIKLFACSKMMDTVLYGLDTSRVAYIISDEWKAVADALLGDLNRGVTILRGEGAYTGLEKRVLLVAFKQKEIVRMKKMVHDIDPNAFFIACDAHEVLGEGFGEYQKEEI